MRYIFAETDRAFQIKRIKEGIEEHRSRGASNPKSFQMRDVYDDILQQLSDRFLGHWKDQMAVVGLGGYGRMEMSPYSDIDLLFLKPENAPEGMYTGIRNILYLLWDSKVELGHSVRTVRECTEEAVKDLAVLTSLMDTRPIWGDERIFRSLLIERERLIRETDPLDLYLRIEAEIRKSCEEFGQTIYLLEPYVKEGPGSLRYMQLIAWLGRLIFGCAGPEELPIVGVCGWKSVEDVRAGLSFLSEVRTRLHLLSGRRDDRLKFEAQTAIAEQMGFMDTPERRGVVSFMREYYRHVSTMEFFGQRVLARARLFLAASGGALVKRMLLGAGLYMGAGGINSYDAEDGSFDAAAMLRAFLKVAETGTDLDIRLTDLIRIRVRSLSNGWIREREVNSLFLEIFHSGGAVAKAMKIMMNTGFLERFIAEFEAVRFLRLHDVYHIYTVDRHTIAVLEQIDRLGKPPDDNEDMLLRSIFARIEKPELVYLAGLLHDIGKGRGPGHEIRGEQIARPVLERLGLSKDDVEDVLFLVRNHLAMTHLAFKKDLHDQVLLTRFAETVIRKRRLDMLMILTHADLRATGPSGFNSWRGLLLEELYYRTLDEIDRESAEGEDLGEWLQQIKAVVRDLTPPELRGEELETYLEGAQHRYLLDFYPETIADHYRDMRGYLKAHGKDAFDMEDILITRGDNPAAGYSAITIMCKDRSGLFYRFAGIFSANRVNILSAWSHSVGGEVAVATFHVHEIPEGCLSDPHLWESLQNDLKTVIGGARDFDELVKSRRVVGTRFSSSGTPRHKLSVNIDNAASDRATVVEVYAHDRPWLLYDITRRLWELGVYIVLTKITTEGRRAADTFYVVDEHGEKVADFERLDQTKAKLRDHLAAMEESLLGQPKSMAVF